MASETLSVVMLNYNYAQYIGQAIRSMLEQAYQPFELIVIDDGSTDSSVELIAKLIENRPFCRLIRHTQNRGILYSLKEAVETARGTYLYLASSDDYIKPGFFRSAMECIENNPGVGLFCARPVYLGTSKGDQERAHTYLGVENAPRILKPEPLALLIRKSHFSIAGSTCIYRRELILRYGGFRQPLRSMCDAFLIYQIAFRHPIAYIPEPFAVVRLHASSYSAGVMRSMTARKAMFDELLKAVLEEDPSVLERFRKAGVLLYFGKQLLLYMLLRPKYWAFLPPIFDKQIRQKWLKVSSS